MHWFDYSLIKYMPNPKRGEIVNLGIVVFRASGIDIRLLNASTKARILDGDTDYEDITSIEQTFREISELVQSPEEQYRLLKGFGSGVFISEKNSFSISGLGEYESKVNRLFNDLVKPFSSHVRSLGHSRFQTQLKHKFKSLNLLAEDVSGIAEHKVVANYPIDSGSGLTADFMIKNGKYHMSEVIDFNVNDVKAKFKETTLKVMTFVEGRKNLNEPVSCYFVYKAGSNKEKEVISHLNLAEDYSDKTFNLSSRQDEANYFQMIREITGVELELRH